MTSQVPVVLLPTGTAASALGPPPAAAQALRDLVRQHDLDESGTFLAWQLADMASGLAPDERDAFTLLLGRLLVAQGLGSTCIAVSEGERALLAKVPDLVAGPAAHVPLILDGNHLYGQRSHACESRVARVVAERLRRPGPFPAADLIRTAHEVARTSTPAPNGEQVAAAVAALAHPLGIISGGPGTGKTTTALAILRVLVRLGIPPAAIALAAPTGKAASRLDDELRLRLDLTADSAASDRLLLAEAPPAQTLHRLLGATGGPFGLLRTRRLPLALRAVIVDESSMIDLVLMDRLLSALAEECLLVLLGDAAQLPAVSVGAVFRDLEPFGARLGQGFRANPARPEGKQIAEVAAAVAAGDGGACVRLCTPRGTPDDLLYAGVEQVPAEFRDDLLRRYYQRRGGPAAKLAEHLFALQDGGFSAEEVPRLEALAAHLGATRVLAVTRGRRTGVERCNDLLHDLHGGGPGFRPGEPLLMLRNDRERDLANGDQGVVVRVQRPGYKPTLAVAFPTRQGWIALDPKVLGPALGLGFALTVHKAQGSEFDEILLLLPDLPCPLLTRELLYTALSRARRSVVLCGSAAALTFGVSVREQRDSGIAERLAAAP